MADYLIAIADKARPALRREIEAAFKTASTATRRGQGSIEGTLLSAWADEALPRIEAAVRDMSQQVMADAGKATMDQVRMGEAWRYDAVNPSAVAYVREHTGRLIVQIDAAQRAAVQQVIGRVVGGEISGRQAEKHIRNVIGMTSRMEAAAWKVREQAIARGLKTSQVDRVMLKYRDTVIRKRAETIARTETISALSAGRVEAWTQAIDQGLLSAQSEKKWIVTQDDRLCPICAAMAGEKVGMDEAFTGGVLYPPRHPRCRCAVTIVRAQRTALTSIRVDRVPVLR